MTKRLVKNSIILLSLVAYLFVYRSFVLPHYLKYSDFISASFLAILLALCIIFLGVRKDKSTILFQNVFKYTTFYVFLTGFAIYGMGFFVGFLKNAYSRELVTLINNIFVPIVICFLIELIRYVFIWANKDKKVFIVLLTIIFVVLEISFKVRSIDYTSFEELFRFASSLLLPTIIKNAFFSYVCYHVGYKVPVFYRLLADVFYVYVVPIIPDLGEYLHAIVAITLPVVIYINIYEMIDSKCDKPRPLLAKKSMSVSDIGVGVVLVLLVCLVSGLFPIYMIGIGSSSMSPVINRGDAVVIQKVNADKTVKKGDIIAYSKKSDDKKKIVVVHRVVEVTEESGKKTFVTRGDANNSEDSNPVSIKQVRGVVRLRIPFVAYPTIYLNDLLTNWR